MTSKFLRPFSRQKRYVQCGKKSSLVVEKKKSWFSYPLSTPRTRLSMKKEPITMRGTKQTKLKDPPKASLVCKRFKSALTLIAYSQKFKQLGWAPLHFHCTTSISAPYSQEYHPRNHRSRECIARSIIISLTASHECSFMGQFAEF